MLEAAGLDYFYNERRTVILSSNSFPESSHFDTMQEQTLHFIQLSSKWHHLVSSHCILVMSYFTKNDDTSQKYTELTFLAKFEMAYQAKGSNMY